MNSTHPALKRRRAERERLLQVAREYTRRLSALLPLRLAVVAGSVARGDFHTGSDIDVVVVSDALPAHPLRRAELLYQVVEGGVEPKGFTMDELRRQAARRNPLVVEAIERGIVVYPEDGSTEALRQELGWSD